MPIPKGRRSQPQLYHRSPTFFNSASTFRITVFFVVSLLQNISVWRFNCKFTFAFMRLSYLLPNYYFDIPGEIPDLKQILSIYQVKIVLGFTIIMLVNDFCNVTRRFTLCAFHTSVVHWDFVALQHITNIDMVTKYIVDYFYYYFHHLKSQPL